MRKLTPEGETTIADIARRHGVSPDAVRTLLEAVANGGGAMAQFSHPELGGGGQWLRGGMTMVGDMFDASLKAKVDAICSELSDRITGGGFTTAPASTQAQTEARGGSGRMSAGVSFFAQDHAGGSGNWWPADLGRPAATGAQNTVRYAFFPEKGRLAIDNDGRVEVYDTLDHSIQGFGQQQGGSASLSFTSQHGPVHIDSLPRIGAETSGRAFDETRQSNATPAPANADGDSVLATLERLAGLKEKGILSEEEFAAKKTELLKRL